jgi:hypothetical protein
MIINGNDNTLYAINDRFCLYKNGETTLLSDGILFEGQWICDNKTKEIHLFLFSKYSNEQSGMGYKANYEIKIKGKIEKITDFETRLKGICNACIEEHNYGTLPVLPSITEMVYPVLWELIKL